MVFRARISRFAESIGRWISDFFASPQATR